MQPLPQATNSKEFPRGAEARRSTISSSPPTENSVQHSSSAPIPQNIKDRGLRVSKSVPAYFDNGGSPSSFLKSLIPSANKKVSIQISCQLEQEHRACWEKIEKRVNEYLNKELLIDLSQPKTLDALVKALSKRTLFWELLPAKRKKTDSKSIPEVIETLECYRDTLLQLSYSLENTASDRKSYKNLIDKLSKIIESEAAKPETLLKAIGKSLRMGFVESALNERMRSIIEDFSTLHEALFAKAHFEKLQKRSVQGMETEAEIDPIEWMRSLTNGTIKICDQNGKVLLSPKKNENEIHLYLIDLEKLISRTVFGDPSEKLISDLRQIVYDGLGINLNQENDPNNYLRTFSYLAKTLPENDGPNLSIVQNKLNNHHSKVLERHSIHSIVKIFLSFYRMTHSIFMIGPIYYLINFYKLLYPQDKENGIKFFNESQDGEMIQAALGEKEIVFTWIRVGRLFRDCCQLTQEHRVTIPLEGPLNSMTTYHYKMDAKISAEDRKEVELRLKRIGLILNVMGFPEGSLKEKSGISLER